MVIVVRMVRVVGVIGVLGIVAVARVLWEVKAFQGGEAPWVVMVAGGLSLGWVVWQG